MLKFVGFNLSGGAGAAALFVMGALVAGCDEGRRPEGLQISRLWEKPSPVKPSAARAAREAAPVGEASKRDAREPARERKRAGPASRDTKGEGGEPIAIVNGDPIARQRVVEFLLRSHGVGVLEQLIVLDVAAREAADRGIDVTPRDIDAEYDRWLRRLTNPELAGVIAPDAPVDRAEGERLLERVLAVRNISREEFMAGVRRNAHLRKIVEHDMRFTDAEVRSEFDKAYGERVTARHIQVATAADAERIAKELRSPGADFSELARRHSANPDTAASGGRMQDFSREDEDVPAPLRSVAFDLEPGRYSNAVRIGEWFHIVTVDARHPASDADFAAVRGELEARLRRRQSEPAMQRLHQKLLEEAKVEITDPVLAEEYEKNHPRMAGRK